MDWKRLIAELKDFGLSQIEIAHHCHCSQTSVSELSRGLVVDPRFSLGDALKALRARYPKDPAPRAPGTEPVAKQFDLLADARRPGRPRRQMSPPAGEHAAATHGRDAHPR